MLGQQCCEDLCRTERSEFRFVTGCFRIAGTRCRSVRPTKHDSSIHGDVARFNFTHIATCRYTSGCSATRLISNQNDPASPRTIPVKPTILPIVALPPNESQRSPAIHVHHRTISTVATTARKHASKIPVSLECDSSLSTDSTIMIPGATAVQNNLGMT